MTIREQFEALENTLLSNRAVRSVNSVGRQKTEDPDPVRTCFQRDRDRVIHSKAFRRLKHKTQVFLDPEEDHYRTRMTHTLETAQIARTIARGLSLNEDLTEAIALSHDLGHTPFGHAGEFALDESMREFNSESRFRHHEQSLRVVDFLERDGKGLNLTNEVRIGIIHHTKGRSDIGKSNGVDGASLEADAVRISDRIAYLNHDFDDAVRAEVLSDTDLPKPVKDCLGTTHSKRIATMVIDVIQNSQDGFNLNMSDEIEAAMNLMKDFMYERLYVGYLPNQVEQMKARNVVKTLFKYYLEHPDQLPERYAPVDVTPDSLATACCDYVAGMTDRYAAQRFEELFVPKFWGGLIYP